MKLALLAPAWYPVPPPRYGGIERVVSILADGLVEAGHEVTLFAARGSRTKAELAGVLPSAPAEAIGDAWIELAHALACYERDAEFDLINDHSGPIAAALGGTVTTPVVHTVHGPLSGEAGDLYASLARVAPRVGFVSVSLSQRAPLAGLRWVANCHHGLDLDAYPVHRGRGDYLLFLGRMHPDKGCHRAVEVAREAGVPLKIVGKMREPAEREYFETYVAPHLGSGIEYLGETSEGRKIALLQNARAMLFPIEWEEPFGLVLIESMACGTPVIATRRGAVPEVVDDGRSGIVVDDESEMIAALALADELDPLECRRYVEERFSAERMVRAYEVAYTAAVEPAVAGRVS